MPRGSEARDREGHGCLTPLSPRNPQGDRLFHGKGGVVYADDSGAVSITSSKVTGCSAGEVRRVELAASLQRHTAKKR